MTNYFDTSNRVMNEDTKDRMESFHQYSGNDRLAYDRILVNKILNQSGYLSEADKYNIASIILLYMKESQIEEAVFQAFADHLIEKFGEEWYSDMINDWEAN